jgi:tryptophanyl-tRNA synthetase
MSKSLGNAIYLSDPPDIVVKKVKSMFTDPNHIRVEDPGQVEGNTVFSYLEVFDPDIAEVARLKDQYRRGGLANGVVKGRLTDVLEALLTPIRKRRTEYAADLGGVKRMLATSTERARNTAQRTLKEVRDALGIVEL